MLGKLLKYDLKWVYKVVVIFYILAIIVSLIGRGLGEIQNSLLFNILSKIIIGTGISLTVSSLINCLMRLWARFTKNLYKDESYLTHTLPAKKRDIYLSKVIAAIISIFTTVIVILACLFICYYSKANMEVLKAFLELAASTYNTTVIKFLLLISFVAFLEILFVLLIGYAGIVLGHKSNKNKMLISIIISIFMYFILQTVNLGVAALYGLVDKNVMNIIKTTDIVNVDAIKTVMYLGIGVYVFHIIFLYILGRKQFAKGVNVD